MLQRLVLLIGFCLFPVSGLIAADKNNSEDLLVYTEDNPPFTFEENGSVKGVYVELVMALFDALDIEQDRRDITVVPWARAYNETLLRKETMLFSIVRTPERENSFKWVGPIGEYRSVLFARKDRALDLGDHASFQALKVGVTKNSRVEQYLLEAGVAPKNLIYLNSPYSAAQMLARGRIDAWSRDFTVGDWTLRELGYAMTDYEVVHSFDIQHRYIAFNKATDDKLIKKMQLQLDRFRQNGTLAAITQTQSGAHAASKPHLTDK